MSGAASTDVRVHDVANHEVCVKQIREKLLASAIMQHDPPSAEGSMSQQGMQFEGFATPLLMTDQTIPHVPVWIDQTESQAATLDGMIRQLRAD